MKVRPADGRRGKEKGKDEHAVGADAAPTPAQAPKVDPVLDAITAIHAAVPTLVGAALGGEANAMEALQRLAETIAKAQAQVAQVAAERGKRRTKRLALAA